MSGPGHNSGDQAFTVAADELRAFVERIERLNDEKAVAAEGIKEVRAEAKGRGYDPKTIDRIVALRRRDKDTIAEENALLDLYGRALGMEIFG